jgi:hypothetical protein
MTDIENNDDGVSLSHPFRLRQPVLIQQFSFDQRLLHSKPRSITVSFMLLRSFPPSERSVFSYEFTMIFYEYWTDLPHLNEDDTSACRHLETSYFHFVRLSFIHPQSIRDRIPRTI